MSKEKRFVLKEKCTVGMANQKIFVDRRTGVQYLWIESGYAGGLTVLVDREGKPMIDTENTGYEE